MEKKIYVTYTHESIFTGRHRFAVECDDMGQANEVGCDLNSRPGIKNVRINRTGRGLPENSCIFFYAEYMYHNKTK